MPLKAVTVNLGCASPSAVLPLRRAAAATWAERVRREEQLNLVFAQEVPDTEWLDAWELAGWSVSDVEGPRYRVRSVLLWRGGTLEDLGPLDLPTADYHGSYVAGRLLGVPGLEREVAVMSVHASPSPVSEEDKAVWITASGSRGLPVARDAQSGTDRGTLWDSDMVVASCRLLAETYDVLAAGDLNECLAWDDTHSGEWGARFHERVTAGGALELPFHRIWGGERRTYFARGRAPYQLDHALATPAVARLVRSAEVDDSWTEDAVERGDLSDHAPIRFSLA